MKQVITKGRVPVKMWLDGCESGAMLQAHRLSKLPFLYKHVALMPDCHQGYGMPIGGVIACEDVVIPNAVGVDIGCGMVAACTNLHASDISYDDLHRLVAEIAMAIPMGFHHHNKAQDWPMPNRVIIPDGVVIREFQNTSKQIGTLGGGNHFIEIQKDENGFVWIMIHSGSRNVGKRVADHHNKIAKALNAKWNVATPPEWQLAHLPVDSKVGQDYIKEMMWCVEFAELSRGKMMTTCFDIFDSIFDSICPDLYYDVAHNFAAPEEHYGKRVWVHRKGATRAFENGIGIIPGSQGTRSYIVEGLGNPLSFKSCSHGAGRAMSRTKARETLSLEIEREKLDSQGILHSIRGRKDLDEAAGAYKDIVNVMSLQDDLVKIIHTLTPMAVLKG